MSYHICKSRSKVKPFSVVLLADNGEVLSQHSLKTKQACWKNILSAMSQFWVYQSRLPIYTYVQDDTLPQVKRYKLYEDGKRDELQISKKVTRYVPGKNPVKKKASK